MTTGQVLTAFKTLTDMLNDRGLESDIYNTYDHKMVETML